MLGQALFAAELQLKWQPYDQPGFVATRRRQYAATELALTDRLQKLIADAKAPDQLILAYLQRLVNVCVMQAKYDQAKQYADLSLRYAEKNQLDEGYLAMLHYTLAKLLCKQDKYSQSELEYKKAVALLSGVNSPAAKATTAKVDIGLAEVYSKQKRYQDSEKIYRRLFADEDNAHAPESSREKESPPDLVAFAECLVGLRKFDEAALEIRKAINIDLDELGAGQPALAADYNDLACVLAKQMQLAEAEKNMMAAVKICRAYHYADLPDWVDNLTRVLHAEGKTAEANDSHAVDSQSKTR